MANKSNEFCYIALKYSQISSTIQYINETIQAMTEAWEDILLKIDRKITKYSKVCKNQSCLLFKFSPKWFVLLIVFQLSYKKNKIKLLILEGKLLPNQDTEMLLVSCSRRLENEQLTSL